MMAASIEDLIQDRDRDGVADYLNVRIFVPDDPSPEELAAASNIAARLAFETLSLDLPLGFPISAYDPADSRIPIFIGRAASAGAGVSGLRFQTPTEAQHFAYEFGRSRYSEVSLGDIENAGQEEPTIEAMLQCQPTLVLGPEMRSFEVIDLAARIGLESTCLKLPLAVTDRAGVTGASILIGRFPGLPNAFDSPASLPRGRGRIELIDAPGFGTAIAISGVDEAGEAEAIRHAAQRLPNAWDYGEQHLSLESVAVDIRRQLSHWNTPSDGLIFEKTARLRWEVETALARFEETVVPLIQAGSQVVLELRISEPPAVRRTLQERLVERLVESGANPALTKVDVLSAYKQGYSWISETLAGELKGAHRIHIRFRALVPDANSVDSGIRWLQELYPVDEVLARQLGISADDITFERMPDDAPHIYEVLAEDVAGNLRAVGTFDPQYAGRPLFERFPDYGNALVTTGWIKAAVNGTPVVDERIETDPEQFWRWYQQEVLSGLADHLIALYGGKIDPECAPHFGTLEIDLMLSEPDYTIGVDEERISSLEALHEDIYFETLLFLDVLGQRHCNRRLAYPGRIVPRVQASLDGSGAVHVRLTGKQEPGLPRRELKTPRVTAIEVQSGRRGPVSVAFRVLAESRNAYPVRLSYPALSAISLCFNDATVTIQGDDTSSTTPHDSARAERKGVRAALLSQEGSAISTPVEIARGEVPTSSPAESIVQWVSPIGPEECERIVEQLAAYPEIHPYRVGTSYLGRSIWALDIRTPVAGRYFSPAKASVEKSVLLITGRQHANEVSSTSHILRLAELLVTDEQYKKLLQRVIFVLHPMTNPDGAQLVEDLRSLAPGLMLHACYLGALGMDVTDRYPAASPIYPEAEVRPALIRNWKPGLILNPHGYPSHEWVQLFAGYSAWVRSREVIARDWWIPRGWFIPRLEYTQSQKDWVTGLLDTWAKALDSSTGALNERMRRRYRKYGAFDPGTYRMSFHGNLLVDTVLINNRKQNEAVEIVTEVPDEVAEGPWLHAMATAGLECSLATAAFAADWSVPPQRLYSDSGDGMLLCVRRLDTFARSES